MSPNRSKRTEASIKSQAITRELEALREREWRARRGDFNSEFSPRPLNDPELTSRLFGPDTKTVQWRRE